MRVAHITDKYPVTGEYYIYDQLRLSSADSLLLIERHYPGDAPFRPFVAWYKQPFSRVGDLAQRGISNRLTSVYRIFWNGWLKRRMRAFNPDIVHAHFMTNAWKALPAVRALGAPLIVTTYGMDVSSCLRDPLWVARFKDVFEYASLIVVLADEIVERLTVLGCPREKIVVWDIGVPIKEYPYRAPRAECKRFLCAARFIEKKGQLILLAAFDMVCRELGLQLTLMGHGALKDELLQEIERRGLQQHVTLVDTTGRQDFYAMFHEALKAHDVFVIPSIVAKDGEDEGGPPVVIAFAQAVGLPIIGTPVGGIPRAVRPGETGLLAESGDPVSLAACIREMAGSRELREKLSKGCRALVERQFDVEVQVRRVGEMYSRILAQGKSR